MISYGMLKILGSNSLWVIKNSGIPVISILRTIFGGKILFLSKFKNFKCKNKRFFLFKIEMNYLLLKF